MGSLPTWEAEMHLPGKCWQKYRVLKCSHLKCLRHSGYLKARYSTVVYNQSNLSWGNLWRPKSSPVLSLFKDEHSTTGLDPCSSAWLFNFEKWFPNTSLEFPVLLCWCHSSCPSVLLRKLHLHTPTPNLTTFFLLYYHIYAVCSGNKEPATLFPRQAAHSNFYHFLGNQKEN